MADVACINFAVMLPAIDNSLEMTKAMDWFLIVFLPFKILVLGTGMFFAIKWHHDQEKNKK